MQEKRAWKSSADYLAPEDRDRQRPQLGVGAVGEPVRADRPFDIDMGGHRQRVDAGIGPPGGVERHLLVGDRLDRLLDRLLDRRAVRLALPAHERAAVIFDGEAEAGHAPRRSVAPTGMSKPRSSSSGRHRRAAGTLDQRRHDRAVAAGDGEAVVEHGAGLAASVGNLGGEHFDPLAFVLEKGARRRVERADLPLDLIGGAGRNRAAPHALSILGA